MSQKSHPMRNGRTPRQTLAHRAPVASSTAFLAVLLACACGEVTTTTPVSSGSSGRGGAFNEPAASGAAGSAGAGGVSSVLSQCIFNKSGDPVARFEVQDAGVIKISCASMTS